MDIFKLLASIFKRVVTAISSPFRLIIVRIQRMFNINLISAKFIQPLNKNVRKLLRLRPSESQDYVKVGKFMVFKQLILLLILALCAGVLIYFSMFAKKPLQVPQTLTEIKTDVTFRYDDIAIKEFTGVANIKAFDDKIVYVGDIEKGVCKGVGILYTRQGNKLYSGQFGNNLYNGAGILYAPEGAVTYEGQFADNLYQGEGKLYNPNGVLIYSGTFAAGLYDGAGKLFDNNLLIYEGGFSAGKFHGTGAQYYPDGGINYKGEFLQGSFSGQGELYEKNGRLLYVGSMFGGEINYRGFVGATLADIQTAFKETPAIMYSENGNNCFYYEKAGVVITTDCKIKIHEQQVEKDETQTDEQLYYIPETVPTEPETVYDEVSQVFSAKINVQQMEWVEVPSDTTTSSSSSSSSSLSSSDSSSSSSSSSSDSSSSSSSSSSSMDSSAAASASASAASASASTASQQAQDVQSAVASAVESAQEAQQAKAQAELDAKKDQLVKPEYDSLLPSFVEKTKQIYFEVEKDVWQAEEDLDESKVFVNKITVLSSKVPSQDGMKEIGDDQPPSIEDCVAIDALRRKLPTVFPTIQFEMDKENKLFQKIWNINNANKITRKAFIGADVTYRYTYAPDTLDVPAYYSIES